MSKGHYLGAGRNLLSNNYKVTALPSWDCCPDPAGGPGTHRQTPVPTGALGPHIWAKCVSLFLAGSGCLAETHPWAGDGYGAEQASDLKTERG